MATTQLNKTLGTPTNNYKWTISCWIKRAALGDQTIMSARVDGSNNARLYFNSSDQLSIVDYQSTNKMELVTSSVYRDVGAFYNIVVSSDNSLGSPVTKMYVNGVETTNGTSTQYSQNQANLWNSAIAHYIGQNGASASYYNGLISYFAFVDGTAYDASYFGETNAATGIWTIKTSPSVTYGTNGFFLKMDTSSPGSDTSGNNNTFTASGTPTLAQDNASNNLVTMNPLCNVAGRWTITNGNNTIQHANGGAWTAMISSIASSVGKYYMETKITAGASRVMFGVMSADTNIMSYETNLDSICLYYNLSGGEFQQSGGTTSGNNYGTFADNDIAGIALDCTNNKISIYKNGTALVTDHTIPTTVTGPIGFGFTSDSNSTIYQCNYGNGFFGTTAVASSNADAAGHGLMEYAVPTGFYTLNTKNLNTYG